MSYNDHGHGQMPASAHNSYGGPGGGSGGGENALANNNREAPCEFCRKRRVICIRVNPGEMCNSCVKRELTCVTVPKLKRMPRMVYVEALEALLGTLLATADGNARGLLRAITEDPLAREVIARAGISQDGPAGLDLVEALYKWDSLTEKSARDHAEAHSHRRPQSRNRFSDRFLQRVRHGYWNRRGDHLTPERHIVYAPPSLAYPAELAAYPSEEEGYQNEAGELIPYAARDELPESIPRKGRAPERPYESFVIYVGQDLRGLLVRPTTKIYPKHKPESEDDSPQKSKPPRLNTRDLQERLTALNSRPPKSPTSSSSSYGSSSSVRSRASSWSSSHGGSIKGHIPGTSRDVMEFPFGYPIPN